MRIYTVHILNVSRNYLFPFLEYISNPKLVPQKPEGGCPAPSFPSSYLSTCCCGEGCCWDNCNTPPDGFDPPPDDCLKGAIPTSKWFKDTQKHVWVAQVLGNIK